MCIYLRFLFLMMNTKRLLPFILLNIVISALTALLVLYWWERAHQVELPAVEVGPGGAAITPSPASGENTAAPSPTPAPLPPLEQPVIEVQNVFAAGDLQNEAVVLKRVGEGDLWMTGWKLYDEDGNVFIFPELLLNKGGGVQLYTAPGANSVIKLYWGLEKAAWEKDELVTVVDYAGNERAIYRIP